jgi:RimJ/RimL family protein N-acetyltransferase
MDENLFQGELVRLARDDPQTMGNAFSRWGRNSEYMLLLDNDPPVLWSNKKNQEWIEQNLEKENNDIFFSIHALEGDRLIGFIGFFNLFHSNGEAWLVVGVGEPDYWNKGYGSDAIRLALYYAFNELNLHRVTLCVFEYNQRARRAYEKLGFIYEGRIRGEFLRQGERWDLIYMGLLREEWQQMSDETIGAARAR